MGRHIIADLYNCEKSILDDMNYLKETVEGSIKDLGAEILHCHFKRIEKDCITGVAILSESHMAIHTFPLWNFAAIDIFTVGNRLDPDTVIKYIAEALHGETVISKFNYRGELF
jgi:S-adenosylmethionine decarboxylase